MRTKSILPSKFSSVFICCDTAAGVTNNSAEAALNPPSLAADSNARMAVNGNFANINQSPFHGKKTKPSLLYLICLRFHRSEF
ncbi:hypothetical protein METHPM2_710007 [Pseudomonas sp. PM2]